MWGKGKTTSQIAEIIGGISRNAVIGKAHRLIYQQKLKINHLEKIFLKIQIRKMQTKKITQNEGFQNQNSSL